MSTSIPLTDYERPTMAADTAVFSLAYPERISYRQEAARELLVLLVKRMEPPFEGYWSLPGGFLHPGETLEGCAARSLQAKTGLAPSLLFPAGVYSDPHRDPRGWVVSRAFMSILPEGQCPALPEDCRWFRINARRCGPRQELLTLTCEDLVLEVRMQADTSRYGQTRWQNTASPALAFDHDSILTTALMDLRWGASVFRYLFDLLPEEFTLFSLQQLQETITGRSTGAANFRRKAMPYVEETGRMTAGAGHRPAMLYRRKTEMEEEK